MRALTHASAQGTDTYERLEFLGDRVLGVVIAEMLLKRYPDESEGQLAPRFNALVRREACADAARRMGFDEAVVVSASERDVQGQVSEQILADACEAVIAALYLDAGLDAARAFIAKAWAPLIEALASDMRDPKTTLQEWAQGPKGGGRGTPSYRILERSGPDHAPSFRVAVSVAGLDDATGEGRSKREAEQAAARAMLARIGIAGNV